jgi:hypothetical protein
MVQHSPKRIALDRIAVDEALALARQITNALEAAHDKGIIHRESQAGQHQTLRRAGPPPPRAE